MVVTPRIQSEIAAYLSAFILVLAVLARYGRQMVKWLLVTLYDFFILRNPVNYK